MEPKYEEQFVAYLDFLGFSEASVNIDEATREKVLALLLALSALRGEFNMEVKLHEGGSTSSIKPAISTFSDHIVISYPVQALSDSGLNEQFAAFVVARDFTDLLRRIAGAALSIGFLVRGGASLGMMYHAQGVIFGEALVDAVQIESRTSVYPRVVLSPRLTRKTEWVENQPYVIKDSDGLYHIDYFSTLLLSRRQTGDHKEWFESVVKVVARNLADLESTGKLNELAKWTWFARHFREGMAKFNPDLLKTMGISLDMIPWQNGNSDDARLHAV